MDEGNDEGTLWSVWGPRFARRGMSFVCTLPKQLGGVTALEERGGHIVAKTESGIEFIIPILRLK